jgi:hypothetical protein
MVNHRLAGEIIDFVEGRGRFEERDEYVGMDATNISDLFFAYFDSLDPSARRELAATIAAGSLGQIPELEPHVNSVAQLMLSLCIGGRTEPFAFERERLEREFNDAENLRAWLRSDAEHFEGLDFKREWRYALILWGVLYLLGSNNIQDTYARLLRQAQSAHFKRSLLNAKNLYDAEL